MRLLFADCNSEFLKTSKVELERFRYAVDVIREWEDIETYLSSNIYEAAIINVDFPNVDIYTLIKSIRKKSRVPIILYGMNNSEKERIKGYEAGADGVLPYPCSVYELSVRIRSLLRRTQTDNADSELRFKNLVLDCEEYLLKSNGKSVALKSKEFQIMELLMLNPQKIYSTEVLMSKIWGNDSNSELNVVWTNMSRLRNKVNSLSSDVKIATKRNVGYKLE